MNLLKAFSLLVLTSFILGCANSTTYGLKYDYDKNVDFTKLKSYNWIKPPANSSLNELVIKRVRNAVNAELSSKSITISSKNPDFLIAVHGGRKDKIQVTDWGYSYGGHGIASRYGSYGASGAFGNRGPSITTYNYEEGTLILDFVDPDSKKLIWRGVVKAEVQNINTPEKSETLVNKAVKTIFSKYPPPISKK